MANRRSILMILNLMTLTIAVRLVRKKSAMRKPEIEEEIDESEDETVDEERVERRPRKRKKQPVNPLLVSI